LMMMLLLKVLGPRDDRAARLVASRPAIANGRAACQALSPTACR